MNFCGECGARLEPGVKYCTGCGTPVGTAAAQDRPPATAPAPASIEPVAAQPVALSPDAGVTSATRGVSVPAILVSAAVLLLGVAAAAFWFTGPDAGPGSPASPTAEASAAGSGKAAPMAPATPAIDPANLATTDGMMGIAAGQSWPSVASRFDPKGHYEPGITENCQIYESLDKRVSAMVEDGMVTSLATDDRRFRTPSNIGVGSTLADLRKAYGSRLSSEENPYAGKDYFVLATNGNGIKFHVDDGRVTDMTAGGHSIRYVEGCL